MLGYRESGSRERTHVVALSVSESTTGHRPHYRQRSGARLERTVTAKKCSVRVCEVVVVEMREVATQLVKR